MKITCEKQKLEKAALIAQRFAPTKLLTNFPEGTLLVAKEKNLFLKSYNLEVGVILKIDAQVKEEGEIVLASRVFSGIAKKAADKDVNIQTNNKLLATIISGQSSFSVTGISSKNYPTIPEITPIQNLKIKSNQLKKMINRVMFAVLSYGSEANPVYSGVLFEIKDNNLFLVSVDGYRMALCKTPTDSNPNTKFIVPGKALLEISKLIDDNEEEITEFFVVQNHVVFCLKDINIIARLIEGNFLDYKSSIPKDTKAEVVVSALDFINAVERVSLVADDNAKTPIRLVFEKDKVKLFCKANLNVASDELKVRTKGEVLEIGLNNKYLLDALKSTGCDMLRLEFSSPLSPVKILPTKGDDFMFLVLPVRLKSG